MKDHSSDSPVSLSLAELYAQALALAGAAAGEAGQPVRLRVVSGSMVPCLRVGDVVTAVPALAADLRCGDLVVLRRPGDLLTHRLLSQSPGGLWTKGDAYLQPDPLHPWDALVGRVCLIERDGRQRDLCLPAWRRSAAVRGHLARLEAALSGGLRLLWPTRWPQKPLYRLERALNLPFRLVGYLIQWARRTETTF